MDGIDLFHHDSLHTYEQMKFEYDTVYDHLLPNGVLASHDVFMTTAFREFVNEKNMQSATVCKTGIARSNKK